MVYNVYMKFKNSISFLGRIVVFSGLSLGLVSVSTTSVFADDAILDQNQAGAISQNCASIKQSLRALQRTDARTRAYLGAAYEKALSDFITPMDLRLINISKPNANLTTIHSNVIEARQEFVHDYTSYSQKLEELITHDCQNDPQNFYHTLLDTRAKREKLQYSTEKIRKLLSDHLSAVKKLEQSIGGEDGNN